MAAGNSQPNSTGITPLTAPFCLADPLTKTAQNIQPPPPGCRSQSTQVISAKKHCPACGIQFPSISRPHPNSGAPKGPGPALQHLGQACCLTDPSSGRAQRRDCPTVPRLDPRPLPPFSRPAPTSREASLAPSVPAPALPFPPLPGPRAAATPGGGDGTPPLRSSSCFRKHRSQSRGVLALTDGRTDLSSSPSSQGAPPPRLRDQSERTWSGGAGK